MAASKTRDLFLWTDDNEELLLRITQLYKVAMVMEIVD